MHFSCDYGYSSGGMEDRSPAACLKRAGQSRRLAFQYGPGADRARMLGYARGWLQEARRGREAAQRRRLAALRAIHPLGRF